MRNLHKVLSVLIVLIVASVSFVFGDNVIRGVFWGEIKGNIARQADIQSALTALETYTIEHGGGSAYTPAPTAITTSTYNITAADNGRLLTNAGATADTVWTFDTGAHLGNAFSVGVVNEVNKPYMQNIISNYHMNNTWLDNAGGNNGTASGAAFSVDAKIGSHSGSFDGSNDYVDFGTGLDIADAPMSINVWIKPTSHTHQGQLLTPPSGQQGYVCALNTAAKITFGKNGVDEVVATDTISDGVWTMITIVYSVDDKVTIYKNGTPDSGGQLSYTTTFATGGGHRFGWQGVAGYAYTGLADELTVWNKALSANDIETIYNSATGLELFKSAITLTPASGEQLPNTSTVNRLLKSSTKNDYIKLRTTDSGIIAEGYAPASANWVDTAP